MKMHERKFVEQLARDALSPSPPSWLQHGIGDDCAILRYNSRNDLLVTTDLMIENVHFRREWQSAVSVGHKTLARGLSDIAAMGGTPQAALLSLAVPPEIPGRWISAFMRGFLGLARRLDVLLVGGDTSASSAGVMADCVVIGQVPRGKGVLRSGARPGDQLWVSGTLGGAACGLSCLRDSGRVASESVRRSLFYPEPRIGLGEYLREQVRVSSMMDLSDGLSIDLSRLCQQSRVGARIVLTQAPKGARIPMDLALHGGEDFELLFTVPPRNARRLPAAFEGVRLTCIGQIEKGKALKVEEDGCLSKLPVRGFEHF